MKKILKMLELVKHFLEHLPYLLFLAMTVIQAKPMILPTKMYLPAQQGDGRRYVDFQNYTPYIQWINIQAYFTFDYDISFRISGYFIVAGVFASD